jgi:O-antigen/teichoic acid export membrane protein
MAVIPLIIYINENLYQESVSLSLLAIGILLLSSITFVARFSLLGITNVKIILIFDIIGTIVKFVAGFLLVSSSSGAYGILFAFLIQAIFTTGGILFAAIKILGFRLGDLKFIKVIVKDALVNVPAKISRIIILNLVVIMLASFGIDSSEVGVFYIALMISSVVSGFATSTAFMSIPASSQSKTDFSATSTRIGLSFTAPVIAVLIVAPGEILSIVGRDYVAAELILIILSIRIIPFILVSNSISRLNNQSDVRKLLVIGFVQVIAFLISFYLLVPSYGSLGAAYSILVAFVASSIPSLIWSERILLRYTAISITSIVSGSVVGYMTRIVTSDLVLPVTLTLAVSIAMILAMRGVSKQEVILIVKSMFSKMQNR